jgi:hypothetical protein
MREFLMCAAVLAVTSGVAHAGWSEYGDGVPARPLEDLRETCDLAVVIRGGIVEGELHARLENTGSAPRAAVLDLELPARAVATGLTAGREGALPVPAPVTSDSVPRTGVIGADPALLTSLGESEHGRPLVQLRLQPIASEAAQTVSVRWTAPVEIRDGALRITLPGRGSGATHCRGVVTVAPGPGARVERIRLDSTELAVRSSAAFSLGESDATLAAVLAFARPQPVVWTQTQQLGRGYTAQAVTIATPVARSTSARRALLVIDGSRSMELVGRHNNVNLVHAIGDALPAGSQVEAVIFDRKAARVLGAWQPVTSQTLATIETAVTEHAATNGSDTVAALAYAKSLVGDWRGQTQIVLLTDGVLGELADDALANALASPASDVDLHAIVLAPGHMTAPETAPLRAAVDRYGGSLVEVATSEVDAGLASIDEWLRPAWHELALAGFAQDVPVELRAGSGIVQLDVTRRASKLTLTGHGERAIKIASTTAPAAAIAQLALAAPGDDDESARAKLREHHVAVDDSHAFAVLASGGSVATSRRKMVAGGGPYTRLVDVADATTEPSVRRASPVVFGGSAIDRTTIELLLRQYLQPSAFVCYQKAIAHHPELAGTAKFTLEIGRGELTQATVAGVGNATFDACLLDAAYIVTPPLPNPDLNIDDRSIVSYPLTFTVREQKAFIVAGDADSASPLDIDAIKGGVPASARRGAIKAGDTSPPLGNLRPAPMK